MFPHHLPQILDWKTCPPNTGSPCTLKGWTVSENYYDKISIADTGGWANSAREFKAKIMATQAIQKHAGNPNANFDKLDGDKNHC